MAVEAVAPSRRVLAKERRRQQLIDATINCIARKGLGATTLGDVAREAGLSQGIINLHFESKDNLLAATLRYLAEEYDSQFMKTLNEPPADPARKLLHLMAMDLKPSVCDRKKLAVWFAFWGEVKAVPTYQKICAARDEKYQRMLLELTEAIVADGGYFDIRPCYGRQCPFLDDGRHVVVLPDQSENIQQGPIPGRGKDLPRGHVPRSLPITRYRR